MYHLVFDFVVLIFSYKRIKNKERETSSLVVPRISTETVYHKYNRLTYINRLFNVILLFSLSNLRIVTIYEWVHPVINYRGFLFLGIMLGSKSFQVNSSFKSSLKVRHLNKECPSWIIVIIISGLQDDHYPFSEEFVLVQE